MSDQITDPVMSLAVDMGYNPDFDGENKKTPEEFIKHGAKIQRNQSEKIKDLIDSQEGMRNDFVQMQETFNKSLTAQQEQSKREYEGRIADLETRREQAVDEADVDEFKKVDKELQNINKKMSDIKPSDNITKEQKVFNDWWSDKQSWLTPGSDAEREMNKAIASFRIDNGLRADQLLDVNKELDAAEKHLKKVYPDKFGLKPNESPGGATVGEGKTNPTDVQGLILKKSELTSEEKKQLDVAKKYLGKSYDEKKMLTNLAYARKA